MKLNVGLIEYYGTNCLEDSRKWFENNGHTVTKIWFKETEIPKHIDFIKVCGGFPESDREFLEGKRTGKYTINPGVEVLKHPITKAVFDWIDSGKPCLAVCAGFQMIMQGDKINAKFEQNIQKQFYCNDVKIKIESPFFGYKETKNLELIMNVAHGYGRIRVSEEIYKELKDNDQIWMTYQESVNGSDYAIAGLSNKNKNLYCCFPHPERDFKNLNSLFIKAIERYISERK